jgi:uncharacterized membrane protein
MPSTAQGRNLEQRLASLESGFAAQVATLYEDLERFERRVSRLESGATRSARAASTASAHPSGFACSPPPARVAGPPPVPAPAPVPAAAASSAGARGAGTAVSSAPRQPLGDLVGGRVLAWLGGIAILTGTVLFLALAIAHGWIGREARVILAAAASSALMAGGVWLRRRGGRTEASAAMVGAATAGLFATIVVATQVYSLLPLALALPAVLLVGALASTLAIRWAGQVVGGIGLVGALLAPVLVGTSPSAVTIAVVAVAAACATWVVIRTGWAWLGLVSVVVSALQWGTWLLGGERPLAAVVAVLVWFATLGLVAAIGLQARAQDDRLRASAAALATLSAFLVGVIGQVALREVAGSLVANGWLAALAIAHVVVGLGHQRRVAISPPLRRLLMTIGMILADVAFVLSASGVVLLIGWAGTAVAFAWLTRRTAHDGADEKLAGGGLGAHLALTLTRTLIVAPPALLGAADAQLVPLFSLAVLAATCLGSAHLVGHERATWRRALNALGLASIAYLTAVTLGGPALVCAWALEALALARLGRAGRDPVSRYASFAFLGLASAYALATEALPNGLVVGVDDLAAAAIALAVIALVTFLIARMQPAASRLLTWMTAGAAAALLYLVSIAIVTVFQPSAGASAETVLDLSVRQQGQVILSFLWTALGLGALIVGLKRRLPALRSVALGWLLVCVGKVFLYDLSTLTSVYRVVSFTLLGLLLLVGAFAYQRLRPPPLPDMRSVHPSQL